MHGVIHHLPLYPPDRLMRTGDHPITARLTEIRERHPTAAGATSDRRPTYRSAKPQTRRKLTAKNPARGLADLFGDICADSLYLPVSERPSDRLQADRDRKGLFPRP